jgi:hypothetical protein
MGAVAARIGGGGFLEGDSDEGRAAAKGGTEEYWGTFGKERPFLAAARTSSPRLILAWASVNPPKEVDREVAGSGSTEGESFWEEVEGGSKEGEGGFASEIAWSPSFASSPRDWLRLLPEDEGGEVVVGAVDDPALVGDLEEAVVKALRGEFGWSSPRASDGRALDRASEAGRAPLCSVPKKSTGNELDCPRKGTVTNRKEK